MTIMKANFDIYKQCPQMNIYIIAIITSILVNIKYSNNYLRIISSIISGIIGVIILMGINYCDWTFQWLTYIFSAMSAFIILGNILLLIGDYTEIINNNIEKDLKDNL